MIKPDWQYVKTPLLVLMVSIIVSATLFFYSHRQKRIGVESFQMVEKSHAFARRRSVDADRDRALYERYLENFTKYSEQGYIGDEQRLNWIEQLQLIDDSLGLIALHYDISPQAAVAPMGIVANSQNVTIQQSKMKLRVELLHEGDFFKLLMALRRQAKGIYVLSMCNLNSKMNKNVPRFNPSSGNLSAECDLDWYTVKVKG